MRRLDPPFGARDPGGMGALIHGAPEQIESALEEAGRSPFRAPARAPELLAVGAMGGSAMAPELCAALAADRLPRPVVVVRDDHWPALVGPNALAVLASYSGATEETLELYRAAGALGVPRVAITTGGPLGEMCDDDSVAWARLPSGMPPRAALYSAWVMWSFLIHSLGWMPDPEPEWREAISLLRRRRAQWGAAVPDSENLAKRVAREIEGKLPFLYGASTAMGAVALRWRTQLNENAKVLGHSAAMPELQHNEVVGWERPGAVSDRSVALLFHDPDESPGAALRCSLTGEYLERSGLEVLEIQESEGGRLARAAAMVYLGDYVSFYLAMLLGVDPTPIESIAAYKRRLAEARAARAR